MTTKVKDVMTAMVVVANEDSSFKGIVGLMHEYRVSALPVVDDEGRLTGIVSEADMILKEDPELGDEHAPLFEGRHRRRERDKAGGRVARDLMTTTVVSVGPEDELGEAARRMHEASVKRLPVVDLEGRVLGIVSRADLLRVFLRADDEIGKEIEASVIGRTFRLEPGAVSVSVADGVVTLRGQVERHSLVAALLETVRSVTGVVGVDEHLTYEIDDLASIDPIAPWAPFFGPR